jgi:hypothetical protein
MTRAVLSVAYIEKQWNEGVGVVGMLLVSFHFVAKVFANMH